MSHLNSYIIARILASISMPTARCKLAIFVDFGYLPFPFNLYSLYMRRAIYPGSFDPVTNGHLDIIERGCKLFDEIIIGILVNPDKQPFFTIEERQEMLNEVVKSISKGIARSRRFISGTARQLRGGPTSGRHRARHPRHLRLRIRVADGSNEPTAGAEH